MTNAERITKLQRECNAQMCRAEGALLDLMPRPVPPQVYAMIRDLAAAAVLGFLNEYNFNEINGDYEP